MLFYYFKENNILELCLGDRFAKKTANTRITAVTSLASSNKVLFIWTLKHKVRGYGALLGNRAEFTKIFGIQAQIKPTKSDPCLPVSAHRLQALEEASPPGNA